MHEIAQLIITNNFRVGSLNLRNKNVSLMIIIDMMNYANENENNFYYTSNSQLKNQKSPSNINANFNDTIDENNNALNNLTPSNENRRFKNLTSIQRFRFIKLEIEKLINVKKLKFI